MALFGKKEPGKKASKEEIYLAKRGLSGLETDAAIQVKNISTDLAGLGLMKTGMALSFAKSEEQAKVGYLSALVEQNWILIKQNDEIIKLLKDSNNSY